MYSQILANVARHVILTPEEAARFTHLLGPQQVASGEHVLVAGERATCLWFVVSGCVRTYATDAQGREHNLAFSTEGWWCTDSASFFEGGRATLALQALETTSLLSLSLPDLENLCTQVPKFERFFRLLSQKGYQLLERRLVAMLRLTAEARFIRFYRQYPRLLNRVAQKHIAAYLGITPEFLSMLRRKHTPPARS
ncbi:Crp/Fnr family transcriptional regulator [Hymenobacter volaticus]|uniref:Crp/Fnr family transcriptional regulator n=1 Tax=Hymenobacter volaticus TaxID=2932254 RepID=A0ABY4GIC4_9BACT|nr:Crp/Fnr family transcriptional regulator [Hymenobacter volaticus]UOQ69909.1 Crp/Fnr family transcriptional regulator [Hymenobacter volaticus]